MFLRRLLYLTLLVLLPGIAAYCDTFIVTTTATSGPGSLREAIDQANKNGTIVTDFIHFNLPRGRDITIRIALDDLLPDLNSNLVIDGTTQPGPALGITDAKVTITLEGRYSGTDPLYIFRIRQAVDIGIYGLFLKALVYDPQTLTAPPLLYAILMNGSQKVSVGDAGRGNLISGWNTGIYSQYTPQYEGSYLTKIKGNIFGLDIDGVSTQFTGGGRGSGTPSFAATNQFGVLFERDVHIYIGGETPAEGNYFNSLHTDIFCAGKYLYMTDGEISIVNNKMGIDVKGQMLPTDANTGIRIRHFAKMFSLSRDNLGILVRGNNIAGKSRQKGIYMDSVQTFFLFENNILGGEESNNPIPGTQYGLGIHLVECEIGMIGGDRFGYGNIIRYWKQGALLCDKTSQISFRFNSTYCNKERAIEVKNWELMNSRPKPMATVNHINIRDGIAEGTATPNSVVDLYIDDNCPDCEGQTHVGGMFAVIYVDGTGRWNFGDGLGRGNIVVTATDAFGSTSEYSTPTLDTSALQSIPATCTDKGGSICGLKIISGTQWQWEDENGMVIGTDTCLLNVKPGKYFFRLSIGSGACEKVFPFIVKDQILRIDSTRGPVITSSRCGKNNGSICGFTVMNATGLDWEDENGNVVSVDTCLINAKKGKYRLRVRNVSCEVVTAYYSIEDNFPVIDKTSVKIEGTTCGLNNGSISGLTFSGNRYALPQWINSAGIITGKEDDLIAVGAGNYKLVLVDKEAGCGDSTDWLTVPAIPSMLINNANVQILAASCGKNNGSIINILIENGKGNIIYRWVNELDQIVGTQADLAKMKAGKYRLKVKDESLCDTVVSPFFEIVDNGKINFDSSTIQIRRSGCNQSNGSITGLVVNGSSRIEWRNVMTGESVGNGTSLTGVEAGKYIAIATNDFYGCADTSHVFEILSSEPLNVDVIQATIHDATCGTDNGFIRIQKLTLDSSLFTYEWKKDDNTFAGTSLFIRNLAPGIYECFATDSNGCKQSIYIKQVLKISPPAILESLASVADDTCALKKGGVYGITVTSSSPISYTWYNEANEVAGSFLELNKVAAGKYHLIATDKNNCTVQSSVYNIGSAEVQLPKPSAADITIPRHGTAIIKVLNVTSGTYELKDGSTGTLLDKNNTGVFVLAAVATDRQLTIVHHAGSCNSVETLVKIFVVDITDLIIPNAFTPNGDGYNDVFVVTVRGYFLARNFQIFNRWGQTVYQSNQLPLRWDGRFQGKAAAVGTYYYVINGVDINNKPYKRTGSITLIR
ncbi:MAG TPA: gliding motility-associated C-terminal domain-containing protein [Flavitalea sp.]|nr:gliding motility-associated C-terminal domain-containing protein [Flavitalea sp.]